MLPLADLHMHTYYSDGDYSPQEVVKKAALTGCEVIAITDHDTLLGIKEADKAAAAAGIRNVHAIEISCYGECEVHILGYNIDVDDQRFLNYVKALETGRAQRAELMLAQLKKHNIVLSKEWFARNVPYGISRSHIARALYELGYESDPKTAFTKWLKEGAPAYVKMEGRPPQEAIAAIHACGGKAVLAHPVRLKLCKPDALDFIRELAQMGLDGIEAVYKKSSSQAVRFFRRAAKENGLIVTCGGDYHGDRQEILPRRLSPSAVKALEL